MMHTLLLWVWFLWAASCVWLTYTLLMRIYGRFLSIAWSRLAVVLTFISISMPVTVLLVKTGIPLDWYDSSNPGHVLLAGLFYFSPFGIPLPVGLPVAFWVELSRKGNEIWRR
ncbi:MAG: hypothetical protein VR75_11370 [Hyphomonadaceae bacterium BRH_c29]|nr:MAG: hypothetical protein VR75_11370 [Hyphomonadaceae bacterium BRH_c29]